MGNGERLTLEEAAEYLRKSPSWLYRNRERLAIKGHKIGGCWQFYKDDLDKYIESIFEKEVYRMPFYDVISQQFITFTKITGDNKNTKYLINKFNELMDSNPDLNSKKEYNCLIDAFKERFVRVEKLR